MQLTSTYWYEIIYADGERIVFQFLDTTLDGRLRCRLCNQQITFNIFRGMQMEIIERGENNPCEQ